MSYKYLMQITLDREHIRVVDRAIDSDRCQRLCEGFRASAHLSRARRSSWVNLDELDISSQPRAQDPLYHHKQARAWNWDQDRDSVAATLHDLALDYQKTWAHAQWPSTWLMEGLRIKRYTQGQAFGLHVDSADRITATRFLSFLVYLNDHEAGTHFPNQATTVEALQGRVVMFPPLWPWPHEGLPLAEGPDKLILSSYLLYP